MNGKNAGIAAMTAGVALAITGVALYFRSRGGFGGFGKAAKAISRTEAGGMKLTHFRDSVMPINQRVGIIQDLVWKSIQDPRMRKIALQVTKNCPARDGECEARAIFQYVKQNVRYTGDVGTVKMGRNGPTEGVDLFQSAYRTIEFGGGDCDDHTVLNSTLLALNGINPRMRVTAPANGPWQHIYAVGGLPKNTPGKWVALDTTLPRGQLGTEVPYGKKRDFVA